jgi:hypothetical protein
LSGWVKEDDKDTTCGRYGRGEKCIQVWLGSVKERDHLEVLCIDWRIILKCFFNKYHVRAWIRLIWLRIGNKWQDIVNTVIDIEVL